MTTKAPKQPRALRLADAILKPDCTKTSKENAANELRRLYELNQELYKIMNESFSVQQEVNIKVRGSLNLLGKALTKSREFL